MESPTSSGFVKVFAGDNRYVVDYLVEEVLKRQPERVRNFLLQTSILEGLCGQLCDAVTNRQTASAVGGAERGNFFVVPLDDNRHWYRYHYLFADLLSAHLRGEQPDQIPILHRRACEWYEQNERRAAAIRHALAAADYVRAATLVELAVPETASEQTGGDVGELVEGATRRCASLQAHAQRSLCGGVTPERRASRR